MKLEYHVYQAPVSRSYCFRNFKFAMKNGWTKNDYVHVYCGSIKSETINEALEQIWELLNINRPEDYHARSLSMSDLVMIDNKFYYCDSVGWSECPEEEA